MPEIIVNLPPPAEPYSIFIEQGLLSRVGEHVRRVAPHARCLLAMDANLGQPHGGIVQRSLEEAGYEVATATVTAEERRKTPATAEGLYRVMLEARLERKSPVIALGGGIVGDIVGFAAATYLRGVPLVHVPTTLLAMVDAAIGGKTGVNFPLPNSNDLGKNLIGAFWQPKVVLSDPTTLLTLRRRDFVCGLAECVKHAVISDAALLQWIHDNAKDILALLLPKCEQLIVRCAAIKASIVAEDEREDGRRALLNLGHTFGHALESVDALDIRHGEAVALGLAAALDASHSMQRIPSESALLVRQTLERCGLPITIRPNASADRIAAENHETNNAWLAEQGITIDRLINAMAFDKKVADGRLRLVLPREIGLVEIVDDVPESVIRHAWRTVGALP